MGIPMTAGTAMNMMMIPRCAMTMEKSDGGMKMRCACKDESARGMMQNRCAMLQGAMVHCCITINNTPVCCGSSTC